jgi:hypothetical protein
MDTDQRLRIEIKNKRPVELVDLTTSFLGIADEYKRFMESEFGILKQEDVSLYIQEIRTGSIIADLVGISPALLPLIPVMKNVATVIQFGSYLKKGYDFLLGKSDEKPNFTKNNYQNFAGFLDPVAKDNASQLNINTVINGNPTLVFTLSSIDANAAQNMAKREIGLLSDPLTGIHKNVVLYWYQVKKDWLSQTGDRVTIESIYPHPVKVIFDNEEAKSSIIMGKDNLFTSGYLADVAVETINGKPVLYKILNIHSRIEYPPQSTLTDPPTTATISLPPPSPHNKK